MAGSVAAALGRGPTIEHQGKVYDLAPIDHAQVIADFQLHLRSRVLNEVDQVRQLVGPLAGDVAMRAYLDNASAGVYNFASPYWLECSRYPEHQKALVWFCLRAKDRTVTRPLAEQIYKDCFDEIQRLFYGDPAEAPSDGAGGESPNSPAAAGSAPAPAAA